MDKNEVFLTLIKSKSKSNTILSSAADPDGHTRSSSPNTDPHNAKENVGHNEQGTGSSCLGEIQDLGISNNFVFPNNNICDINDDEENTNIHCILPLAKKSDSISVVEEELADSDTNNDLVNETFSCNITATETPEIQPIVMSEGNAKVKNITIRLYWINLIEGVPKYCSPLGDHTTILIDVYSTPLFFCLLVK